MSKLELGDLKNIIKISNRLSEEQIGKILNELKEDPNFVVDIDKSLSETLLKFNKLYGDESISKVKFIIDQYGKFNNEKSNGTVVGGQPPNGWFGTSKPDVVVVESPKSSKKQTSPQVIAALGTAGAAVGQMVGSLWHGSAQPNQFEVSVNLLIDKVAKNVQPEKEKEVFEAIRDLLAFDKTMVTNMIYIKYPETRPSPMMPGMPFMPVGQVTTAEKVGTFLPQNNLNTMELLSRYGYMAHTPVYPGGSQPVQQTGGRLPDDDFKLELNENEDGLMSIPIVNLGGAISSFTDLPVMDITFDGMIGGGVDTDQPTIYLDGDAEGMVGVPTLMDLFGLQDQANQIGGALTNDSPIPDLVLSGGDDDDDNDDDDDLEKMKGQLADSDSDNDEAPVDEGSLFSDELYTLSDVSN